MRRKILAIGLVATLTVFAVSGCGIKGSGDTEKYTNFWEAETDEDNKGRPNNQDNFQNNNRPGDNQNAESNDSEDDDAEGATVEKFDVTTEYNSDEKKEDFDAENVVNNSASGKNIITLNKTSIKTSGSGMTVKGSDVTITKPGTYYVSGTLDNGQIIVDAESDGTVYLVMNGASITCKDNAPIYCIQAELLVVNLVKGTTTTLTDGSSYVYPDSETDEPNACLYCDDDLTINGEGNLVVNANYNNGIVAKDILKFYNGNVSVTAKNNGVKGKDGIVISGGKLTVKCDGDGLKADNTSDASKGYILIENGYVTVTSGEDGIQAETCLKITGGDIDILTGEGSGAVSTGNGWATKDPWGSSSSNSSTVSMKGIKAGTDITITNGTVKIDSEDDSIHSNATINISGGDITTSSGDDGVHSDTKLIISSGKINVTKSYEGLESSTIEIKGGDIKVKASDDGINAAGGDGSSANGRPGANGFSSGVGEVIISGGKVYLNADGDGLDSNGTIVMTGGDVSVDGPTNNGNGPLDYDKSFSMTGGMIHISGSSGMLQSPNCSGSIYGVTVAFSSTQSAGTKVTIKNSSGKIVTEYTPSKNFAAFEYAGDNLIKGEYTIYLNGEEYDTFTVSENNTTLGSAGGMGPGGPGGFGGGGRPGRW